MVTEKSERVFANENWKRTGGLDMTGRLEPRCIGMSLLPAGGRKAGGTPGRKREAGECERMRGRRACFCIQAQQAWGRGGEIGSRRK